MFYFSISHQQLLCVTAIFLTLGLIGLGLIVLVDKLSHEPKADDLTPPPSKATLRWKRIALIALWCVSFAICWIGSDQKLEQYSQTDKHRKLAGKETRMFVHPSQKDFALRGKYGFESVIRITSNPYAYIDTTGDIRYYLHWELGCASHFSYESTFGKLRDNEKAKLLIPAQTQVGIVLADGTHIVSHTWCPSSSYIDAGSRGDVTCQTHVLNTQYSQNEYLQLIANKMDSVWVDTGTERMIWPVNNDNKNKMSGIIRALYDEMDYMSQMDTNNYHPQRRLIDNMPFNILLAVLFILLVCLSMTVPYKLYKYRSND